MRKFLFLAFVAVPLVDAAVLIAVGARIGWVPTVALVVLTALLGTILVRAEGRRTLAKLQRSVAAGQPPADELIEGGLLIAAGALLLTPGLVTDAIGFLFALPITRPPIRSVLKSRVITPQLNQATGGFITGSVYTAGMPNDGQPPRGDDETIDIESPDDESSRERNA